MSSHSTDSDVWVGKIRRAAVGIALVGLSSYLCHKVLAVNATTAGFVFLVEILLIASGWGFFEALATAIAAVLLLNYYFLPPVGHFIIADPQNWVALLAFLITALVASQLSAKIRHEAGEAIARRKEVEQLYSFSRAILLTDPDRPVGSQIAVEIARIFGCPAVAVFDAQGETTHYGGQDDLTGLEEQLRAAAVHGTYAYDEAKSFQVTPVRLGGKPIGSIALSGVRIPEPVLDSLANLAAIGLERSRSQEATNRAVAARRSEELKSTLLDSIAHEFKTPLTSIKAAASGLLSMPNTMPAESTELATIIDEETDRLSRLVTEAIQMSRVDAGKIRLDASRVSPLELVTRAIAGLQSVLADRVVRVAVPESLPLVEVDPDLMALAIRNVVDNAAKYSPAATPIEVSVIEHNRRLIFEVADSGDGILDKDRLHIFEKFFRAEAQKCRVPGSGLGLSIARDIVRAHKGEIWTEPRPGPGSVFRISLPVTESPK